MAKSNSFSTAADELQLSRAMVSKTVSELETHLGVRLLNRTTRRVSLTQAGSEFYEFAVRLLREISDKELALSQQQKVPAGFLRILAPRAFGSLHLGRALAEFSALYPDIHTTLVLGSTSTSGEFEFMAEYDLTLRMGPTISTNIISRKLATLGWAVCASPEYLERHGVPQTPDDLVTHNCLLHTQNFPHRFWRFGGIKNARSVRLGGTFAASSVIALRDAAVEGLGIALLPLYCCKGELQENKLVRVLEKYPTPDTELHAVVAGHRYISPKVRALIAYLARWANATL